MAYRRHITLSTLQDPDIVVSIILSRSIYSISELYYDTMADDMSQGSENSDYEDDGMCEDDDYYDDPDDFMETETDKKKDDPEYFEFELLKVEDVDRLLNESVEALCKSMQVGLVAVLERAFITGRNEVVAKVMFLQVCVCPQGGGVCLSACWDAIPPRDQADTPQDQADTLPPRPGRHPPRPGRHPPPGTR